MRSTSARSMRVQVDRLALIAAIERKQAQCKRDWEKYKGEYEERLKKWRDEEVAYLEKKLALVQERVKKVKKFTPEQLMKGENKYLFDAIYARGNARPPKEAGGNLGGFDNILRMLRMSKKDSISLSEEQFATYMDGCPVSQ